VRVVEPLPTQPLLMDTSPRVPTRVDDVPCREQAPNTTEDQGKPTEDQVRRHATVRFARQMKIVDKAATGC
jgi:hypothetical protein